MTNTPGLRVDPGAPAAPLEPAPRPHRLRRVLSWVLVVLFGLLVPITLISGWAVRTVTNTDRYVQTLAPLARDKVITNYAAITATDALFNQLHVEDKIAGALPKRAAFIAGPITQQLHTFAETQMKRVTGSKTFINLWDRENAFTHSTAIALLTGKNPPAVSKSRALVVGITPVVTEGIDKLDAQGITVFNPLKDALENNRVLSLQLVSEKQLHAAQGYFKLAIDFRWILLIGTPLIGILAVLAAVERRRAALRIMVAGILACLALAAGLTIGRQFFVTNAGPVPLLVATHLFDAIVRFLHRTLYITLAAFTLLAVILWIVGDSTWAVALRRAARRGTAQLSETAEQVRQSEAAARAGAQLAKAADFVATHQPPFRWAGVVLAAIFLLTAHTSAAILWTLVLLGIYELALVGVVRWSKGRPAASVTADAQDDEMPEVPAAPRT